MVEPDRVTVSVARLSQKQEVLGSISGSATYFCYHSRWLKNGGCQLLAKICALSLVNRSGVLRKSVVGLIDRPDITTSVNRGRKVIKQQNNPRPEEMKICSNHIQSQ